MYLKNLEQKLGHRLLLLGVQSAWRAGDEQKVEDRIRPFFVDIVHAFTALDKRAYALGDLKHGH
jgi:hypothetical protein